MSPCSATLAPNASDAAASLATSVADTDQVLLEPRSRIVAVPAPEFAPGAPYTLRPLSVATDAPKDWLAAVDTGERTRRSVRVTTSCAEAEAMKQNDRPITEASFMLFIVRSLVTRTTAVGTAGRYADTTAR